MLFIRQLVPLTSMNHGMIIPMSVISLSLRERIRRRYVPLLPVVSMWKMHRTIKKRKSSWRTWRISIMSRSLPRWSLSNQERKKTWTGCWWWLFWWRWLRWSIISTIRWPLYLTGLKASISGRLPGHRLPGCVVPNCLNPLWFRWWLACQPYCWTCLLIYRFSYGWFLCLWR